ncbi:sigma-54-dependent Fis family transcriptional regulator [Mesobaculum littorinae]|uniref:Nif-specific regulatory protein n=1 Tax=Mesobaculum littorinae TaxID=2486419 RepID=A0A438AG64_9RHOB|nr:sigma-54 dependent transcriptional regulator [Mesobaculum littorinae]RVV97557.1 sigma-54-dependent Fis family transcriptional regulator [Mesobaculum littorinae]
MATQAPTARDQLTDLMAQAAILVVDDEPGMRNFLMKCLTPHARLVVEAASADEAETRLRQQHFDVVLLDNLMPGRSGLDWLADQRAHGLSDTIMITAYADLTTAIEAMRAGASDFILKPFRTNQLMNAVRRCLQMAQLKRENLLLRRELEVSDHGRRRRAQLIGSSRAIATVRDTIARVSGLPTPVLITGASGTGKEVAARYLHGASPRAAAPFVPINCAAIPPDMIETELFGHARGAFSGADHARDGLLASAQGGTVFLDEVAGLSASAQSALLRVLEDGIVRPVGTERDVQLDLRFVMATNRALEAEVAAGRFREDLLFRINVVTLQMPLLAQRETDVIELAQLFMRESARALNLDPLDITGPVRTALLRHHWPGNIRELRNFVERALIFGAFPLDTLSPVAAGAEIEPLDQIERRQILRALDAVGGNRTEAARRLGVSRKTIDRKCTAWGL